MGFPALILTLTVIIGQLIRIPLGTHGGVTLLDITVVILTGYGFFKSSLHLKKPPLFLKIFFMFILTAIISLILTPLHLSAAEYSTSFFYIIRLVFYFLLYWLIYSEVFGSLRKDINNILLYSGLGLALLGLLQFIFLPDLGFLSENGWDPHYFRTVSTFFDPNFAGAYFVLTLLLIMSLRARKAWPASPACGVASPRGEQSVVFFIAYLALLTTFSRSSYLMFLVGGLALSFFKKSKKLVAVSVLLFIVLLTGFQIYTRLVAKPRGIDREQSANFRINTWQQGFAIFQKSPILGVGYNSYRYAIKEYNLADKQFIESHGSSSNDSSLLSVLATTGVVGFIVYILFLASLFKYSMKNNFILTSAILGLLVHSVFANSLFYPFILIWILLKAADTKG
ncbi:O-antigen ligase family protein [Candidatus Daviesbacteria bacterium]|nr:O-antigen ligase family protein [Candidatus Daviesbacteria bacterium]